MARIQGIGAASPRQQKAWSWSYSKLKNFESCPKKHYEIDIAKNIVEKAETDPNSPLVWGNRAHEALAAALTAAVTLPPEFSGFEHWVARVLNGPGELFVEQKYAINDQFEARGWFDKDVWCRMIGDVVKIDSPFIDRKSGKKMRLGLVLDWKTGKVLEDSVQLMLMAQALFSTYPDLTHVRSEFVWLKDDCTTPELFTREEVAAAWVSLMPRVKAMEQAAINQHFPPKPSGLCKKWCPVNSCPFWGKGA
jgi:hypothetical protein